MGKKSGVSSSKERFGWRLLVVVSLLVGMAAVFPYLTFDPASSRVQLDPEKTWLYPLLIVHILTAFVALATGPVQFWESFRVKNMRLHRQLGKLYLASVWISGATGIAVAVFEQNFTKQMSFLTLAILWLVTGWKGYRTIRRGDVQGHRDWMIRNYAVTLVAVTARLVVPMLMLLYGAARGFSVPGGVPEIVEAVLEVNIWLGIIVNVMLAERVIREGRFRQRLGRKE